MTEGAAPALPGPTGLSCRSRLDEVVRTIESLWRSEPDAAPSARPRLLERLARLETDVDRLSVRLHTGDPLDDELLAACETEAGELRWWWRPTGRQPLGAPTDPSTDPTTQHDETHVNHHLERL